VSAADGCKDSALTPISPQPPQSLRKRGSATSEVAQGSSSLAKRKRYPSDYRKRIRGPRPPVWSNREAGGGEWRTEIRRALRRDVRGGGWDCLRGRFRAERVSLNRARNRCFNSANQDYSDYGARGIVVAKQWLGPKGFLRFLLHFGPKPTKRHTLDRIDVNRGYEPGNVRWADWTAQANNRRSSRMVRWGDEVMTAADLGRHFDLPRQRIVALANAGWFPLDDTRIRATQARVDQLIAEHQR